MLSQESNGQWSLESLWSAEQKEEPASEYSIPIYRVQLLRDERRLALRPYIRNQDDAEKIFSDYLANEDREHFAVILIDSKARVIGIHTVSIGTLTSAIITAREVFKAAILANAASVIFGHNHPSGDPTPSNEDIALTGTLVSAGKLLDIEVQDHIIVGELGKTASLSRLGYMPL